MVPSGDNFSSDFCVSSSHNIYCCFDPLVGFWARVLRCHSVTAAFSKSLRELGKSSFDSFRTGAQELLSLGGGTVATLCRGVNHALRMCPPFSVEVVGPRTLLLSVSSGYTDVTLTVLGHVWVIDLRTLVFREFGNTKKNKACKCLGSDWRLTELKSSRWSHCCGNQG